MNVNFPDCAPDEVGGLDITEQGRRDINPLGVEERHDTWGNPYYWLGFARRRSNPSQGTDLWSVYNGRISVTPLSMNMTDQRMREKLRGSLAGLTKLPRWCRDAEGGRTKPRPATRSAEPETGLGCVMDFGLVGLVLRSREQPTQEVLHSAFERSIRARFIEASINSLVISGRFR